RGATGSRCGASLARSAGSECRSSSPRKSVDNLLTTAPRPFARCVLTLSPCAGNGSLAPGDPERPGTVRSFAMARRIGHSLLVAMFVAAAAAVVWWVWHDGTIRPFGRVLFTIVAILLVGLPWASRWIFGPVAPSLGSRSVRLAGYALLCALIPVLVWWVHFT